MPFTEQDKATISNIVEGFTLAIVEVCQTLEHQKHLPMPPSSFVAELNLRAKNLPTDASGNMKRSILTQYFQRIRRETVRPNYHSVIFYEMSRRELFHARRLLWPSRDLKSKNNGLSGTFSRRNNGPKVVRIRKILGDVRMASTWRVVEEREMLSRIGSRRSRNFSQERPSEIPKRLEIRDFGRKHEKKKTLWPYRSRIASYEEGARRTSRPTQGQGREEAGRMLADELHQYRHDPTALLSLAARDWVTSSFAGRNRGSEDHIS